MSSFYIALKKTNNCYNLTFGNVHYFVGPKEEYYPHDSALNCVQLSDMTVISQSVQIFLLISNVETYQSVT